MGSISGRISWGVPLTQPSPTPRETGEKLCKKNDLKSLETV